MLPGTLRRILRVSKLEAVSRMCRNLGGRINPEKIVSMIWRNIRKGINLLRRLFCKYLHAGIFRCETALAKEISAVENI